MPRNLKIVFGILLLAVLAGLLSLRALHRHLQEINETRAQQTEEESRRAVLAPPISTPADQVAAAQIFWAAGPGQVAPVEIKLPLSADPAQRARQLLQELIVNPPTPAQRTLPPDTSLLEFYVLPDGTAIADFSDSFSSEMPSGIMSEQRAVNSIAETLAANVPSLRRLKILIHGQEVDTLAGHVDLTGFFDLHPASPQSGAATSAPVPADRRG